MEKIILLRCGEIMLKGLNRPFFENKLIDNIRKAIKDFGNARIRKSQGRIYIEPLDSTFNFQKALRAVTKVFAIVSVSPVWKVESDFDVIKESAETMVKELLKDKPCKTFKVETKRGNKSFPLNSPEISSNLGAHLLKTVPGITVDVHNPDFTVFVEVRTHTYIYSEIIPAYGGLPVGTNGKAMLLISGGIDSPVAGWMMAKRGVELEAVHFHSYPYTSERAKEKVIELVRLLTAFAGNIKLHIVPFTDIQLEINDKCPHDEGTIIMRRFMMKIAEKIANNNGALALITGESMGQVASQTIQSLAVTNEAFSLPVFRPLIGLDKNDVVKIARDIDTYETSILPYEDCCTVFVAKHPKTRPVLSHIKQSESRLETEKLIEKAIENTEVIEL